VVAAAEPGLWVDEGAVDVPFDDLPDGSAASLAESSDRPRQESLSASELRWRRDNARRVFERAREEGPEASIALAEPEKAEKKRFEEQQEQLQAGWNKWSKWRERTPQAADAWRAQCEAADGDTDHMWMLEMGAAQLRKSSKAEKSKEQKGGRVKTRLSNYVFDEEVLNMDYELYELLELLEHIERVNVAGEPGSEDVYPLQPALSELEIDAATRAAMTASTAMRQELMDAPPALELDLAQSGWWGTLRALYAQCQAAGRCLGYGESRLGPAPREPVAAVYEEFACELEHACCECPCGQLRGWVLMLTAPKTVRIGVAEIASWRANIYAALCLEDWNGVSNPAFGGTLTAESAEEAVEAYVIGQRADRAEADADHALELVAWERRYANASDEERRRMAEERKADAFDLRSSHGHGD
jgi:hypothetical protein